MNQAFYFERLEQRISRETNRCTGLSKKMDGIRNRYNLKKYWTDLHVWRLKMFRKA